MAEHHRWVEAALLEEGIHEAGVSRVVTTQAGVLVIGFAGTLKQNKK